MSSSFSDDITGIRLNFQGQISDLVHYTTEQCIQLVMSMQRSMHVKLNAWDRDQNLVTSIQHKLKWKM